MKICELMGPSGAGKSAVYQEMVKHGGFMPNPKISTEQAEQIIAKARGQHPELDDFISLVKYMMRTVGTQERDLSRLCAIIRALAKVIIARVEVQDNRWMVIDGGLIHRGQSVDQMTPRMPLKRYYELMPVPDVVFAVHCDQDILKERNVARGGSHDRSEDIERSLNCAQLGIEVMDARGVPIIPVHTTTLQPEKAARACLVRLGILRKYETEEAEIYNKRRDTSPKWQAEQKIIEDMLSDLPKGSWVLDAPVGTGRFLQYYQDKGFIARGLDASADMIAKATQAVKDKTTIIDGHAQVQFIHGDVRNTKLPDKCVDAAVNCRISRWLSPSECVKMLKEMQRVARKKIILTARVRNHEHARGYDLINSALEGWTIARDEAGYTEDYRILEMRPA